MSRTILITGASSSFGEELISRLPNDVKIIAQSRNPLPKINSEGSRIINVISDFSNPGFMTDFDSEVNYDEINEVVHFAASPLRLQNFVSTTSTPVSPVLGSLSTGIPRPSSCTSTEPSDSRLISIFLQ